MKRKVKWCILFGSILFTGFLCSGKLGMADDLWDEDDVGEAEVFDEDEWEAEDSFDMEQYSVELIEGGVRIVSCQMETVPETIQIPAELSYDNRSFSVLEIGEEAFAGIGEVKEIEVAEGIRQIGDYAFCGCEQLNQIKLPKSVTNIGKGAFSECYELHTIQIDEENKNFSVSENCLYQDKKTVIWCSMEAEEVMLSEETETIAGAAFSGCQLLTELEIPATVTVIEENAFETCAALDRIHFQEQSLFQLQKNSFPDLWNCVIYVENEEIKSMVEASEAYEGEEISVVVKKEFALNYECNGGSFDEEAKGSYSNLEEILLPEPDREGFLFLGWSETPEDKGDYIVSYEAGTQGDKTLYAMWEPDTDAEDTGLLNEEEEKLLLQNDEAKSDENKKSVKQSLTISKKKKQSVKTEKSKERVTHQKSTKDSLTEATSEEQKEAGVVNTVEETQTEEVKEGEQSEQRIEMQTEPQERKASFLVILLFIGGLLCTIGSLGFMLYFHMQEKKEKEKRK